MFTVTTNGMAPAEVIVMIFGGVFLAAYGAMGARDHRSPRRRFGHTRIHGQRTRPLGRPAVHGTMRIRGATADPAAAVAETARTDGGRDDQ